MLSVLAMRPPSADTALVNRSRVRLHGRMAPARRLSVAGLAILVVSTGIACTSQDDPLPTDTVPTAPTSAGPGGADGERHMPDDATYEFAEAVHERVTVHSERDDDRDGSPDPFVLDIIRPADAADVPVILVQSPYWSVLGRGTLGEMLERGPDGVVTSMPLWYDNWFVPKGYAVATMDSAGLGQSGGCFDNSSLASLAGTVAALDFFSGAGEGRDDADQAVTAEWSSGAVAMIGKSADSHHALMAATTGHDALHAVISIGTVTSFWERAAIGGTVGTQWPIESSGPCGAFAEEWNEGLGDGTAPTDAMLESDVLSRLDDYRAATLIVQGLRDLNTRSGAPLALWEALGERDIDRRLWLHQGGHTDPFAIRPAEWVETVDAFLDQHLRGEQGSDAPPVEVQRADLTWQSVDAVPQSSGTLEVALTPEGLVEGGSPGDGVLATVTSWAAPDISTEPGPIDMSLFASGASEHHVAFDAAALGEALTVQGVPQVTLRVRASGGLEGIRAALVVRDAGPVTDLDAALGGTDVELGEAACWGGRSDADAGCYPGHGLARTADGTDVLAVGAHGIGRASWMEPSVDPGEAWVDVTFPLTLVQTEIPAGAVVSLVLTVDDPVALGSGEGSTVEIEAGALRLPAG